MAFFLAVILLIYFKIVCLYLLIFPLGLQLDLSKIFGKAFVIVIFFLSFKRITHAYLLKISITHSKKLLPLLNWLINRISAGSAPQILSMKNECTFRFSSFLIIGLCNYSDNSQFDIFSILTVPPETFLSKDL